MFHVANHRQQLIISVDLDQASKDNYIAMKKSYPSEPMIVVTQNKTMLKDEVESYGGFKAYIMTKQS
jgi:hypothetical protein